MTIAPAVVAAIGVATSIAGTAVGVVGAVMQANSQKKIEQLRQRQMELEAQRQQREVIRQRVIASANATASANAGGAIESSGLAGGLAQISGQTGRSILAGSQNLEIGEGIFKANAAADNAGTIASFGNGLSSLGGSILQNYGTISRISGYDPTKMGAQRPDFTGRSAYNGFPG